MMFCSVCVLRVSLCFQCKVTYFYIIVLQGCSIVSCSSGSSSSGGQVVSGTAAPTQEVALARPDPVMPPQAAIVIHVAGEHTPG